MKRLSRKYDVQSPVVNVNEEMVNEQIKPMENKRAGGPEEISAELTTTRSPTLTRLLSELFNRYPNGENTREKWKEGWILPFNTKKGIKEDYRTNEVSP